MAIRCIIFTLILFFFVFNDRVLSIYEDEVGLIDWHHKYIGKVNDAIFHTQKLGRKCVVVSTELNIIASLDLRHGDILWRHVLGNHDTIDRIGVMLAKYVVTLSSMGGILRAWNILDGQMVWEAFIDGSILSKPLLSFPQVNLKNYRGSTIVVYSRGSFHGISGVDGGLIWKYTLGYDRVDLHHIIRNVGDDIYVVGLVGKSRFVAHHIDGHNGDVLSKHSAVFPSGFSPEISVVVGDVFVAFNMGKSSLVSVKFRDGIISFHETDIAILIGWFSGKPMLSPSKISGMFFLKTDTFTAVIMTTNESNNLDVVDKIRHPVVLSDAIYLPNGREFIALVRQNGVKIDLVVKTLLDEEMQSLAESIELDVDRGLVHAVFGNNYVRTDRSHGFRVLVVMEDHSLLLVQQGEIVWRREDGLASIVDVTTCEMPVWMDGGGSIGNVDKSVLERFQSHVVKMKWVLMPVDLTSIQRPQSFGKVKTGKTWSRKLLVVLTKSGKLFGLRAIDGQIVWSVLSSSLRKSEACKDPSGISLHQWGASHRNVGDSSPSVLIIGRCRLGPSGPFTTLSSLDTYTGKEFTHLNLPFLALQVIQLPNMDSSESRLYLLIDDSGLANLYPRSSEARKIFVDKSSDVYWYSVYQESNIVKGYVVKKDCLPEAGDGYSFYSRELWSVIFPPESENILGAFTRNPNEVVHTQSKVMLNEDVVYKHVSKNVVFVMTGTPPTVDIEDSQLVAYVIDTVTGRILHSVTHASSRGPIHAVFSENWIIYHYFNVKAHRNEMSVIEIYDQSKAENKDVWKLITGDHNLTSAISSFSWPEITTKSQSYFFTHSVKTMAVTLTAKGITSKQLLIGTIGDQVLALDKRLIDPPHHPESEGRISPLTEFLPIKPESYVTHRYKVEGLTGILAFPAKLESTTLVFAYGFDLFLARIAPSKTYDSLTQDFSYALLLLTMLALVAAILTTLFLSQKNELREKWR